VLPGVIGLVQATEAVKVLLGIGETLVGRLLTYDALGMRFREVKLRRDAKCPLCGMNPTITDLSIHGQGGAACAISSGNGDATSGDSREPAAPAAREPTAGLSRESASRAHEPVSVDSASRAPEPATVEAQAAGASLGSRADRVAAHTGC
jgi:hypothetical protein